MVSFLNNPMRSVCIAQSNGSVTLRNKIFNSDCCLHLKATDSPSPVSATESAVVCSVIYVYHSLSANLGLQVFKDLRQIPSVPNPTNLLCIWFRCCCFVRPNEALVPHFCSEFLNSCSVLLIVLLCAFISTWFSLLRNILLFINFASSRVIKCVSLSKSVLIFSKLNLHC